MKISENVLGITPCGGIAKIFSLRNSNGMLVKITNFGGIITEVHAPDRFGNSENVCLGYASIEGYYHDSAYMGALIGRYANRVNNGSFSISGQRYQLSQNDGTHHLHGGHKGFNAKLWQPECICTTTSATLKLHYLSVDGEEGYPGNCKVTATYELNEHNELTLHFHAETDQATPINLTQHSYFNLQGKGDITQQRVRVNADLYCPINQYHIPRGEIHQVEGTPFDLRKPQRLGDLINLDDPQITLGRGFNHYFFVDPNISQPERTLKFSARLEDEKSGRVLDIYTTEPGLQLYTAGFLESSPHNKTPGIHSGVSFEPQHCPNSLNNPALPNTILHPGEAYVSETCYRFSTR